MFELERSDYFKKKYKKLVKRNSRLEKQVADCLSVLQENPFHQSLDTHKVNPVIGGKAWSSSVTGDVRIIWDFSETGIQVLELLDIGGHSGSGKVYK